MTALSKITLIALLTASALGLSAAQAADAVQRGGTLVYGRYADSTFLEPVFNDSNNDIWILSNLYDTLLEPTRDGKGVEPGLATAWQVAGDGKSVTLTLRPGTRFSDGSPITAQDVKWSLERASKPGNGIWQFMVSAIDSVTIKDPQTVVINLSHPDPAILTALTVFNTSIMPEKAFEAAPGSTDREKATAFAEHPVGSGPFVLKAWQHNSTMTLTRNPYYWRKGEDGKALPYLDNITFEIVPDDATRILKLQSGELDGAEFIPYSRVNELKGQPSLNMVLYPSTRVEYASMNVRPQIDGKPNPLAQPKVRQALNYATDKEGVIQLVTYGIGKPMTSFMSTSTPLNSGTAPLYPVDVAKAKTLMKEAGYPSGFSTSLMILAGNEDDISIATALQQMWSQIGVTVTISQVDNATRTERYRKGDFNMRLSPWTDDIADPNEIASYFAYSKNIDALHSGWKNDQVDQLFEASQKEMDPVKRAADYKQIQDIYNSTGPTVPLYESSYPVALKKSVHDFVQIPLGNNIFTATWLSKK
ncbi:ABC transporter substrate-binding protein [Sodalis sp. RH15]|uniref:ABC transporter substrate-binding protein n=1 Tax=Sodalis sp. RH15 TaxID=3394330 RepID=UPI0039B66D3E